ncbi:GNAT family N-acetyltransferase [Streptomyces abyssomicinicus]|uniref:GNAT family N-acetyltransferase n=1 Tax=Streptomyces abyssomicinicus TaxID=574929 RepID=UPI0012500C38|nr:GNAT family N-acetyltransferase [Streptomyces abyssomicinicus]
MNRTLPVVRLRVPTDEDAWTWHELFDDPEVMEFFGGVSRDVSSYQLSTARQRRNAAEHGYCFWSVLDEEERVMGFVGAQPWPQDWGPAVGEIEIGWRLGRRYWGRGYVTAAARQTLERVREAGVESVVAMVDAENERSVAVTRRLGMELVQRFVTPDLGREGHMYRLSLV